MSHLSDLRIRRPQRGATMVEFALVAMVFLSLLLATMEFGRWMFMLNAASEATRLGARTAAICDLDAPQIKARMRELLPEVSDEQIVVSYSPPACTAANCSTVEVRLSDVHFTPLVPFISADFAVPSFTTTLARELMNSAGNPACL